MQRGQLVQRPRDVSEEGCAKKKKKISWLSPAASGQDEGLVTRSYRAWGHGKEGMAPGLS